jgi:hypothetical protein
MRPQDSNKFTYDLKTITRNAPASPGVYSIFAGAECVYVETSSDVCAGLLEIYFDDNPRLNEKVLTHFTFDLAAPGLRAVRQNDRIRELA